MSNLILKNSVFIHIPKTGGTAIQAMLHRLHIVEHRYTEPPSGHLFLHQMPQHKDVFHFAFVRHPYTWWPSYWSYSKMQEEELDFNKWVAHFGPKWMGMYTNRIKRYMGIDPVYPCEIRLNKIGKIEKLNLDLPTILQSAGEKFDEDLLAQMLNDPTHPLIKQWANKGTYNVELTDETKEIIYQAEKWVFEEFEYEK